MAAPVLQFVLADKNIRVWSGAIQCLARIGKEISLEWRDNEIILRTLTEAQSVFAAFHFQPTFFDSMSVPSELKAQGAEASAAISSQMKTKFASKVLVAASKMSRNVTKLHCYYASQDAAAIFVVRASLKSGMARTHTLHYEDAEILQPLFRREQSPFQLAMRPPLLHKVLAQLHGTDEMSILAAPSIVQFQSFHEIGDASSLRGALHTAMAFAVSEFDGSHLDHAAAGDKIVQPVDAQDPSVVPLAAVTFNIKELRQMLAFAESAPVSSEEFAVYFHSPGLPVLFSTAAVVQRAFRGDLVLATVESPVLPAPSSMLFGFLQQQQQQPPPPQQQQQQQYSGGAGAGAGAGGAQQQAQHDQDPVPDMLWGDDLLQPGATKRVRSGVDVGDEGETEAAMAAAAALPPPSFHAEVNPARARAARAAAAAGVRSGGA